ncbi:MAG TPA: NADH:flavin oxidoreductase/NADH oxidase [Bryobacteraceae bacterium]|nr:NADH:flavin oxidoreductase/NADH oxidase [Bryobacteraceae bacterium]
MPHLFAPLTVRGVTFRNRIAVSPMCEYSSGDGFASDWHLVHLGSRAVGGAGLVMTEAAAIEPRGRISPADLGVWQDAHIEMLARIARFIREQGAVAGIQLAHAGRKGSTRVPWEGGAVIPESAGGWLTVAPSPIPFRPDDPPPAGLNKSEIAAIVEAFANATRRAAAAGFQVVEIHGAHGYLIGEFLSPLSNHRTDEYGGAFDGRIRFAMEVAAAVRQAWPAALPLFMRISATDWVDDGWQVDDSVELARRLQPLGVDLIDCSSAGAVPYAKVQIGPAYQTPFAERVRREAGILTGAVGMITDPHQADGIIRQGRADLVLLAREFLRNPYWPLHAARELGAPADIPKQYQRAFPSAR